MMENSDDVAKRGVSQAESSLTSCLSKLTERLIKSRLYGYLKHNVHFVKEQPGFRNKKGAADNLTFSLKKSVKHLIKVRKLVEFFSTFPKLSIKFGIWVLYTN